MPTITKITPGHGQREVSCGPPNKGPGRSIPLGSAAECHVVALILAFLAENASTETANNRDTDAATSGGYRFLYRHVSTTRGLIRRQRTSTASEAVTIDIAN